MTERRSDPVRVLLVDDGPRYQQTLAALDNVQLLSIDGQLRAPDGKAALDWLDGRRAEVDVVLLDVQFEVPDDRLLPLEVGASPRKTRRFQGVAILREIRRRWPDLPVVLLTEWQDLSLADAAADVSATPVTYFAGAVDADTLRIRIWSARAEATQPLEDQGVLWGRDPAMRALRHRLAVLARGGLPIVLEGETGTGKSHLARAFIHPNSGRRGPFVAIDLATVPAELVPATLFGALRGSYTGSVADRKGAFEVAHKGTLFLDEIQNVPLDIQKQLLRVLQEGRVQPLGAVAETEVDVKLVVAANVALADLVAAGRFRRDLYMRLSPATRVTVPALRDRRQDYALLLRQLTAACAERPAVRALLGEVASGMGLRRGAGLRLVVGADMRHPPAGDALELAMPDAAWRAITQHPFPGNLREMAMLAENLASFTLFSAAEAARAGVELHHGRLQIDSGLVVELLSTAPAVEAVAPVDDRVPVRVAPAATLGQCAVAVERQVMEALFVRCRGDLGAMAELLLGDRGRARAVQLRLNQLGLSVRHLRADGDR
ncbi:MAG: sigma-54-dependent Fis family transcriptional regulator [Deltaproteobacteria bacterium]|nr:sigma-54-dependent Fis family transcriptional regulator [Deltaproteobacteria bacterium]